LPCVAVCCRVLPCVAVRCRVLQCVAACCSVLRSETFVTSAFSRTFLHSEFLQSEFLKSQSTTNFNTQSNSRFNFQEFGCKKLIVDVYTKKKIYWSVRLSFYTLLSNIMKFRSDLILETLSLAFSLSLSFSLSRSLSLCFYPSLPWVFVREAFRMCVWIFFTHFKKCEKYIFQKKIFFHTHFVCVIFFQKSARNLLYAMTRELNFQNFQNFLLTLSLSLARTHTYLYTDVREAFRMCVWYFFHTFRKIITIFFSKKKYFFTHVHLYTHVFSYQRSERGPNTHTHAHTHTHTHTHTFSLSYTHTHTQSHFGIQQWRCFWISQKSACYSIYYAPSLEGWLWRISELLT